MSSRSLTYHLHATQDDIPYFALMLFGCGFGNSWPAIDPRCCLCLIWGFRPGNGDGNGDDSGSADELAEGQPVWPADLRAWYFGCRNHAVVGPPPADGGAPRVQCVAACPSPGYVTFRLNFHHFDHFELDLRGHMHVRDAAFSCLRLKLADIVLI